MEEKKSVTDVQMMESVEFYIFVANVMALVPVKIASTSQNHI